MADVAISSIWMTDYNGLGEDFLNACSLINNSRPVIAFIGRLQRECGQDSGCKGHAVFAQCVPAETDITFAFEREVNGTNENIRFQLLLFPGCGPTCASAQPIFLPSRRDTITRGLSNRFAAIPNATPSGIRDGWNRGPYGQGASTKRLVYQAKQPP
jgi:hypothetical protein